MPKPLGSHAPRLRAVRALRSVKGRREHQRFAFEGATLLAEAVSADFPIAELYATQEAYDRTPLLRELDAAGTPVFVLGELAAESVSDLKSPTGIVAVAPILLSDAEQLLQRGGPTLVLADANDPANAGTLLRSADAFGAPAVIFGRLGVDPYHPKVVRASMGAIFRLALGVADPDEIGRAAACAGVHLLGLTAGGSPLSEDAWRPPVALVIGNERHGLGRWESLCERLLAIPMTGPTESLSAAVAGSIALYEARRFSACQESGASPKSQDYRA
jgi:RNA methyltransferase, TrmH family